MIFVTVGSAPHDFTRLVKMMDEIANEISEEVVIQKGFTQFTPNTAKWFDFVSYDEAVKYFQSAKVIVGHSSAGPIMLARKFNRPLIVFPRDGGLNEHVDSHQIETAKAMEGSSRMIEVVYHEKEVLEAVQRAISRAETGQSYDESPALSSLIGYIREFIQKIKE